MSTRWTLPRRFLPVLATWILAGALLGTMLPVRSTRAAGVPKPEERGPYPVGFHWVSYEMPDWGTYHARIYYPAKRDGWRAFKDASGGPYPGIVAANGLHGAEWNLTWLPTHLASHGYVVLCFTPPEPGVKINKKWADGFVGGIAKLKDENIRRFSPTRNLLDTETFGGIGYSMGGCGLMEAATTSTFMIDAAVSMACGPEGVPFAKDIPVPIQFQVGSLDGHVDLVSESYESVTRAPKEYVEIRGGNHAGFLDEFFANIAVFLGIEPPADIPCAEQRRVSSRYFTSWFQYHLKGLAGYRTYIFGWEAFLDRTCRQALSDWRFMMPEQSAASH